jgi:co-chaperonin GroES (HSP10)
LRPDSTGVTFGDVTQLLDVPLRLLGNRILVLRDGSLKTYGSGLLVVPDTQLETKYSGVVIRTGPGKDQYCSTCGHRRGRFRMPVQRGDRVLWKRFAEQTDANLRDVKIPGFHYEGKDGQELVFLDAEAHLLALEISGSFSLFQDWIAVLRRKPAAKVGSIIIPDSVQKPENEGTIVATGPGIVGDDGKLLPMAYQPGQYVYWPQYAEQVEPALEAYAPPGGQLVLLQEHMIEHMVPEEAESIEASVDAVAQ